MSGLSENGDSSSNLFKQKVLVNYITSVSHKFCNILYMIVFGAYHMI